MELTIEELESLIPKINGSIPKINGWRLWSTSSSACEVLDNPPGGNRQDSAQARYLLSRMTWWPIRDVSTCIYS